MSRTRVIATLAVVAVCSATGPSAAREQTGELSSLVPLLQATTERWNRGDLDGFIAPYADATTFMTPGGPIDKAAMRARYASRYFTGTRPDQQLRFEELEVRALGPDHALMTGRFVLSGGGKPEQTGRFTLVWAKLPQGWRIIHDHSS